MGRATPTTAPSAATPASPSPLPPATTSPPARTSCSAPSSALGSHARFSFSPSRGNNLAPGTTLLLGPLGNNGGPTQTLQPQTGSPLIDAGSNSPVPRGVASDQRGTAFARVLGTSVDI